MAKTIWSRHSGMAAFCFGTIAAAIYLLMIAVTLPHIESIAGQAPFDMRPLGYGPKDAAALLEALGVDGRRYYLTHQLPLDTLYPALLALTLIAAITWFGQRLQGRALVRLGIFLSAGAALLDYAENLGIVAMILNWPTPSEALIYAASFATISKSVLTTSAVLLMLAMGLIWLRQSKASVRT